MSPPGATPLLLPRGLIFLASLWLIGSWMLTIGVRTPIQAVSASYTPAVRLMHLCMVIGLMIGWPLLRLSQRALARPLAQAALDLLVLLALVQVVIWPLRLVTPWSIGRTAALDAALSGWLLLVGAVVAAATGTGSPGPRWLAMAACLVFCLLGPLLAALGSAGGAIAGIQFGPIMAVHTLCRGAGDPPSAEQWTWIAVVGAAALAVWAVLLGTSPLRRRSAATTA
jgi:hypothetical protein